MIFTFLMILVSVGLVMFLPGYLISLIIFGELEAPERVFLSFGLSVLIVVALGFVLSFLGYAAGIKAITPVGVAASLSMVCIILLVIYLVQSNGAEGRSKGVPSEKRLAKAEIEKLAERRRITEKGNPNVADIPGVRRDSGLKR